MAFVSGGFAVRRQQHSRSSSSSLPSPVPLSGRTPRRRSAVVGGWLQMQAGTGTAAGAAASDAEDTRGGGRGGAHPLEDGVDGAVLLGEGPHRQVHDYGSGEARGHCAGQDGAGRAHFGQHRYCAGVSGGGTRLPAGADHARLDVHRAAHGVAGIRRRGGADAGRQGHEGSGGQGGGDSEADSGRVHVAAVRQPRQRQGALRDHRAGAVARHRRHHRRICVRRGHRWHDHRRRTVLAGAQPQYPYRGGGADRVARAERRQTGPAQDPGHRRRIRTGHSGHPDLQRGHSGEQRAIDRDGPPPRPRGRPAGGHLQRSGGAGGAGTGQAPGDEGQDDRGGDSLVRRALSDFGAVRQAARRGLQHGSRRRRLDVGELEDGHGPQDGRRGCAQR
eukprot:ctg_95.g116